jgi:hypothetical protein
MNNRVLNLIEISWPDDREYNTDLPKNLSYKESNKIKPNEPVFVYGKYDICKHVNPANVNKVKQYFGLTTDEKNLRRANAHITAITKKDGSSQYNTDRMYDILTLNYGIVDFFLKQLHNLTWDQFGIDTKYDENLNAILPKGSGKYYVTTTIPIDRAIELLTPVFDDLIEIMKTAIDDKYSDNLAQQQMANLVAKKKLERDQANNIKNSNKI